MHMEQKAALNTINKYFCVIIVNYFIFSVEIHFIYTYKNVKNNLNFKKAICEFNHSLILYLRMQKNSISCKDSSDQVFFLCIKVCWNNA